jgi:hypothetical protein
MAERDDPDYQPRCAVGCHTVSLSHAFGAPFDGVDQRMPESVTTLTLALGAIPPEVGPHCSLRCDHRGRPEIDSLGTRNS